jgi:hypothetical protein
MFRTSARALCPTGGTRIRYDPAMSFTTIPGVSFLLDDESEDFQLEAELTPEQAAKYEAKPLPPATSKRDTKRIGIISELHAILALAKLGYQILVPFGENQRYDFVIDDGVTLARVQVKTGQLRGEVINFSCVSTHGHRGRPARPYFGQIEFLAVYCPGTEKVYLLPEKELTATSAHLRLSPPRNNMVKTIRWARDFELA